MIFYLHTVLVTRRRLSNSPAVLVGLSLFSFLHICFIYFEDLLQSRHTHIWCGYLLHVSIPLPLWSFLLLSCHTPLSWNWFCLTLIWPLHHSHDPCLQENVSYFFMFNICVFSCLSYTNYYIAYNWLLCLSPIWKY